MNLRPVVLISCPFPGTMPWAFVYLSAYLKKFGESVIVVNRNALKSADDIAEQVMQLNPLFVGIGSLYSDLKYVKEFISLLDKKGRTFPAVIGGQMVTPTPEFAVRITGADIGIIGEGEVTILNLVRAMRAGTNVSTVKGLVVRNGENFEITGPGEIVENLSELPEPDFGIYPEDWWLNIGRYFAGSREIVWRYSDRVVYVHASRGCPYRCNFCYLHSKVRFRDPDDMMQSAAMLVEKYDANLLSILDELVLSTPGRTKAFIEAIKHHIKRPIEYNTVSRFDIIDRMDDELLVELKKSGCRSIGFGFESGSPRILEVMNKKITVEQMIRGVERLTKANIIPTGAFQVGQYSETSEDVQMSIDLMKKLLKINPNIIFGFAITTPFPGSQLHDKLLADGIFKDEDEFYERYFSGCEDGYQLTSQGLRLVANGSAMTDETVVKFADEFARICTAEKTKLLGFPIVVIEEFKRTLSRVNRIICRYILKVHPYFYTDDKNVITMCYRFSYDHLILTFEMISLKFRKII